MESILFYGWVALFALAVVAFGLNSLVVNRFNREVYKRYEETFLNCSLISFVLGLVAFLIWFFIYTEFLKTLWNSINFSKILLGLALFLIISALFNIDKKLGAIKAELELLNKTPPQEPKSNLSPYSQDKIKDKADTSSWL